MKRKSKRMPVLRLHLDDDELVVDSFAGGGGASTGMEWALRRSPDIAINHDAEAIAMHAANHPTTKHFCENIWQVDPKKACGNRRVGVAWFSPDCKHHSRAKGGKPVDRRIRGLAWSMVRWAKAVRPRVAILENVPEWLEWGPLGTNGKPLKTRKGETFRAFVRKLERMGYKVEWRVLRGCDYGAPTIRKRVVLVARCDGQAIVFPEPSHGPKRAAEFRTAAECIDWSIPCPSIFERRKPLKAATLRRIARGIRRYVLDAAEPFVVPVTHQGDDRSHSVTEPFRTITGAHRGEHALISPTLIQTSWGERKGQKPRTLDLHKPMGTIVAGGCKQGLIAAMLAKNYGGHEGSGAPLSAPMSTITTQDHHSLVASHLVKLYGSSAQGVPMTEPMPTVTAGGDKGGGHLAEVRAFLVAYYGTDQDPRLTEPLHTITTKHRFGIVTIHGQDYAIVDIGFRMLEPHELAAGQGFPKGYQLSPLVDVEKTVKGKKVKRKKHLSKTAQVRMIGNSVCPPLAAAIVRANLTKQVVQVSLRGVA